MIPRSIARLATLLVAVLPFSGLAAQAAVKPDTTITIRATGAELAFDPDELAFKAGLRVRIRFVNESAFPHNLVVVKNEKDVGDLSVLAMSAAAEKTGNVPMEEAAKMLTWTKLAQPGTTVEAIFVMPAPGIYTFVCFSPGHANIMRGSIRSLK